MTNDDARDTPFWRESPLLHYLHLLWWRRALLLIGSLLPALLVAGLLNLSPRTYETTFVYERPLTESEYSVLQRRFYSQENLDKIIGRLREEGLADYAGTLERTRTEEGLKELIRFEVSPAYPQRRQTTDPTTSEKISAFKAQLFSVRVTGNSEKEVSGAAAVVTANIENVLPLYDIRNGLTQSIQRFKSWTAEIEDNRFVVLLDLRREEAKLEKFKGLDAVPADPGGGVVLQFTDVESSREFLPLSYQMRGIQSKIITLQQALNSDAEKYDYYLQVLDLHGKALAEVEGNLLNYYTAQQFLEFLGEQLLACKTEAASDYLKAYIRKTENLIMVNTRAGERPVVYPLPRHIMKGTALTFILCLMLAAFGAVALEYRRGRPRGAPPSQGNQRPKGAKQSDKPK